MLNLTLSDKSTFSCSLSGLGRALRALVPLLALSAAACDDMDDVPHDAELEAPAAPDELELVAEAPEAEEAAQPEEGDDSPGMDGPDELQAAPSDPVAAKHPMCCEIVYGSDPFDVKVFLDNPGPIILSDCSSINAGYFPIKYKVYHYYGIPAPYSGVTGPLPLGTAREIPLSYSGAPGAMSCEAWFET
ncbi:hypothetical protein SAMN02745121_02346 [Nannocystis exedens]|uniref:Uncharacterized protein n=1 Tax=Nannocystis exedens TaxID=54 RepID=A0A1I1WGP5_9BACT|nr:hypothetical protein [Nannocystis exedens]PCC67709.1 hypothetical protein NAEX_00717 [Nannocystis exedens]SFD94364.1 hypothetical protein SAMN02745121_02346 [Nannocystis exedens]